MGRFITPWLAEAGSIPPILTIMGLITFFCACGIPLWYFGKYFRGLSKNSFLHSL